MVFKGANRLRQLLEELCGVFWILNAFHVVCEEVMLGRGGEVADFAHGRVFGGNAEIVELGHVWNVLLGSVDDHHGAIGRNLDNFPLEHELEAELVAVWRRHVDDVNLVGLEVALDLGAAFGAGKGHVNIEIISGRNYS